MLMFVARVTPVDRSAKVVEAAAAVFVELGFRRAQMDDVAERLGVSKGTVYRSVDSKETLLGAVLAFGDRPELLGADGLIEVGSLSDVAAELTAAIGANIAKLELTAVATGDSPMDRSAEAMSRQVGRMALELFQAMSRHRVAIMVLDQCAAEVPELTGWFGDGRYAVVDLWDACLAEFLGEQSGAAERAVLARTIVELITLWAVKMPWDPSPRPYPADAGALVAAMVVDLVMGGRT